VEASGDGFRFGGEGKCGDGGSKFVEGAGARKARSSSFGLSGSKAFVA
jgi:hypothetical protein